MARFTLEAAPAAAPTSRFQLQDANWADLPGNIASSAKARGSDLIQAVSHPIDTLKGIATTAQGGADMLLPSEITDALDTYLGPNHRARTPEEKQIAHDAAAQWWEQQKQNWGGLQNIKNRVITDPVGAALDIASVADPALRGIGRAVTPFRASATHLEDVNTLEKAGIKLTAGQRTGNTSLKYLEDELGGSQAEFKKEPQGEQFTGAVLKKAGIDAERTRPTVMDKALKDFDTEYRGLASRNQIVPDQNLWNDLTKTLTDYNDNVAPTQRAPRVNKLIQDIVDKTGPANNQPIAGDWYHSIRSGIEADARAAGRTQGSDTAYHLQKAYHGIRAALDDAMDRSIVTYNPRDAGAWRDLNNRYRNFLVVEKAATGAGAGEGILSPAAVRQATITQHGRRNYGRGRGDYADLARAGEALIRPPNSGTAPRLWARATGAGIGAVLGHAMGVGHVEGGGMGAFFGPEIVGRAVMSKPVQAYLGNQLLTKVRLPPRVRTGVNIGSNVARGVTIPIEERQRRNRERLAKQMEQ